MSTIQRFGSNQRLSEAVVAKGFVFLSGMVPESLDASVKTQTEEVLAQIDQWLEQCGSDKSHLLEATIFLTDMAARACVQALIAKPEWKVEIKVSALQK